MMKVTLLASVAGFALVQGSCPLFNSNDKTGYKVGNTCRQVDVDCDRCGDFFNSGYGTGFDHGTCAGHGYTVKTGERTISPHDGWSVTETTYSKGSALLSTSPKMAPVQTLAASSLAVALSLQTPPGDEHFCTKLLYTSAPAAMEMEELDGYCYAACHACGLDCSDATDSVQAKTLCDLSFVTPVPWQGGNVAGWCGIFHLQPNCYNTTQVIA